MKLLLVLALLMISGKSLANCDGITTNALGELEWSWMDDDVRVKAAIASGCPLTKTARCHYKENVTALNCAAYNGYQRSVELFLKATPEDQRIQKAAEALPHALENSELKVVDLLYSYVDPTPYMDSMFNKKQSHTVPPVLMISYLKREGNFDKYSCLLSANEVKDLHYIAENIVYKFKSERKSDSKLEELVSKLARIKNFDSYKQFQIDCSTRNRKTGPVPNKSLSTK